MLAFYSSSSLCLHHSTHNSALLLHRIYVPIVHSQYNTGRAWLNPKMQALICSNQQICVPFLAIFTFCHAESLVKRAGKLLQLFFTYHHNMKSFGEKLPSTNCHIHANLLCSHFRGRNSCIVLSLCTGFMYTGCVDLKTPQEAGCDPLCS